MKLTYKKPLLLIEGYIDWKDKLLASIIISITEGWGIPYINSTGIAQSSDIIGKIFDRYGVARTTSIPPACVKKRKTVKEIQWSMLQCISGISSIMAKNILTKNPKIFSIGNYTYDLKIKGLRKEARILLEKVIRNE